MAYHCGYVKSGLSADKPGAREKPMTHSAGIGKRIREVRGEMAQKDFARKLGTSVTTLSRYECEKTPVPSHVITRICEATGASPDWLLLGKEREEPIVVSRDEAQDERSEWFLADGRQERMVSIPVLSEIPAGFTEAMTDGDTPVGIGALGSIHVRDPRDENAFALVVKGNSMSPTLSPGDILIVSPARFDDLRFPIVVFRLRDEEVAVKYVRLAENRARVVSDNPLYPPYEVPIEDIHVIGRVVGWQHYVTG